jgi:hypothetical protein
VYEQDHDIILELGVTEGYLSPYESSIQLMPKHYIIEEYLRFSNGRYVPDHRQWFQYGQSQYIQKVDHMTRVLSDALADADYLVGHQLRSERAILGFLQIFLFSNPIRFLSLFGRHAIS